MVNVSSAVRQRRWQLSVATLVAWAVMVAVAAMATPPAAAAEPRTCPASAPDEAAARAVAIGCQGNVEVVSARTEYSETFINSSGDTTVSVSAVPQRVRRGDGSWTSVDPTLRLAGAAIRPAAVAVDVAFSAGGDAPLITWRRDGHVFTLAWPAPLPAPVLSANTATYPNVLPDVDLVVSAAVDGFTHVLVVKTPRAAAHPALQRLRYRYGGDVTVRAGAAGGLVVAADRTVVARTAGAVMWDSADAQVVAGAPVAGRAAGPAERARTAQVPVQVVGQELVLTPAADMLAGTGVQFPLFIDPAFSAGYQRFTYANNPNANWSVVDNFIKPGDPSPAAPQLWVGKDPSARTWRGFLEFPTSSGGHDLRGKQIVSAYISGRVDHTWKCNAYRPTYFYRSAGISALPRENWPGPALQAYLGETAVHANEQSCSYPNMSFEMGDGRLRDDLQIAANGWWGTYTVGVAARDSAGNGESNGERWMRYFLNDFRLVVTYNTAPGTPANLTTAGAACGSMVVTSAPALRAQYVDNDGSDTMTARFEYRELPSGSTIVVYDTDQVPANNFGDTTLNLGGNVEGKSYSWRVITSDGRLESPWSPWCDFTVNSQVPPMPEVDSDDYPADGIAHGGPGVSGSFTFSVSGAAGQDVTAYVYGWTYPPTNVVSVSPGSASPPIALTPPHHGENTLYVQSREASGLASGTYEHTFIAGAPSAPIAAWPLDPRGEGFYSDAIGSADLVPTGDYGLVDDARLIGEPSLGLDITPGGTYGYASSAAALDTSGSFSVSAWVQRQSTPSCDQTVVSKSGVNTARFLLAASCATGSWYFAVAATDSNSAMRVFADAGMTTPLGQWTHLAGAWDEAEQQLRIYVNGVLRANVTPSAAWRTAHGQGWNASGPIMLGHHLMDGNYSQSFAGQVADIKVWNRVVVPDDIQGTEADPDEGTPATPGLMAPIEVGSWDFSGGVDGGCLEALDGQYWSRPLYLNGCDRPPAEQTAGFTGDGHDDNDALWLNREIGPGVGVAGDGHAATIGPVVRTDQSFTVSAWVRLGAVGQPLPTGNSAVLVQDGQHVDAFMLAYRGTQRWGFWLHEADAEDADEVAYAESPSAPTPGVWTLLTGVYDRAAREVRLYINGVLAATAVLSTTPAWSAGGPLVVGRELWNGQEGAHFPGDIDQVRVFAGAMNADQVADLFTS